MDKLEGPSQCLTFLGIEMDTVRGQLRLPAEKLARLRALLARWATRRSCRRRDLESLVGTLQHACLILKPGRAFLRRIIDLLRIPGATKGHHHIRLNREFRADLQWWITFAEHWNGVAMFPSPREPTGSVTSDASGSWGCGAWSDSSWFQLEWPTAALHYHISFKELFAGLVACSIWAKRWRGCRVQWWCDNQAAVHAVNSRSCPDPAMMRLLRCLFFLEAWFNFELLAAHLPGRDNMLADDLSHNLLSNFLSKAQSPDPVPSTLPPGLPELLLDHSGWTSPQRLDIAALDQALLRYCDRGLADSTRRTYQSGLNRYLSFCFAFWVTAPFPVSETLLCYFVTALAREGIAPATIRTYLAAVRHGQIMRGFTEPRESSSLPRLRLVQNGVRRERTFSGSAPQERLPVTPPLLRRLHPPGLLQPATASHDELLLWAAATLCFFVFFRAGEITVPSVTAYDPAVHLSWGDVTISDDGRVLRVFLKRSKTDQYGRGVEVFIGSTADDLCPVIDKRGRGIGNARLSRDFCR